MDVSWLRPLSPLPIRFPGPFDNGCCCQNAPFIRAADSSTTATPPSSSSASSSAPPHSCSTLSAASPRSRVRPRPDDALAQSPRGPAAPAPPTPSTASSLTSQATENLPAPPPGSLTLFDGAWDAASAGEPLVCTLDGFGFRPDDNCRLTIWATVPLPTAPAAGSSVGGDKEGSDDDGSSAAAAVNQVRFPVLWNETCRSQCFAPRPPLVCVCTICCFQ